MSLDPQLGGIRMDVQIFWIPERFIFAKEGMLGTARNVGLKMTIMRLGA
jgi:hypothetical protein